MKSSSEITKAAIWILRNKSGTLRALNYMCATLMHSISQFYPILSNCLKPNYFLINPILKFENFFKILKKIKFKRSSSGQKTVMKFHRQNFQNAILIILRVPSTIGWMTQKITIHTIFQNWRFFEIFAISSKIWVSEGNCNYGIILIWLYYFLDRSQSCC